MKSKRIKKLCVLLLIMGKLISFGQSPILLNIQIEKSKKLYVGLDNIITITPEIDTNHTKISINNGTIERAGDKWVLRVEEEGETNVTIENKKNNEKAEITFVAVFIPDPEFVLGTGKARIPFIEFRTFRSCEAQLKNFDYDVRFKVLNADVYFWGAGFSFAKTAKLIGSDLTSIADLINQCQPGSVVTFDNIHVEGPDGIRVIDSKSYALY